MKSKKAAIASLVVVLLTASPAFSNELTALELQYDQLRQSKESDTYLVNVTLRQYEAESGQCMLRYINSTDPQEIQLRESCKAAFDSTQQSIFDVTRRAANTNRQMDDLRTRIEALKANQVAPTPTPTPSSTSSTPEPTPSPTTNSESSSNPNSSSQPAKYPWSDLELQYDQLRQSNESDTYLVNVTLRQYEAESGQCMLRYVNSTDPLEIQLRNSCKAAFDSTQQSIFDVTRRAVNTQTQMQKLKSEIDALKAKGIDPVKSQDKEIMTGKDVSEPLTQVAGNNPSQVVENSVIPRLSTNTPTPKEISVVPEKAAEVKTQPLEIEPKQKKTTKIENTEVNFIGTKARLGFTVYEFSTSLAGRSVQVVATKSGSRTLRFGATPSKSGVLSIRSKSNLNGYRLTFSLGGKLLGNLIVS